MEWLQKACAHRTKMVKINGYFQSYQSYFPFDEVKKTLVLEHDHVMRGKRAVFSSHLRFLSVFLQRVPLKLDELLA